MKSIEISDEAYQSIADLHGDVNAYVEKIASEAREIAAVQEGINAYKAGNYRSLEEFGKELKEHFDIEIPEA